MMSKNYRGKRRWKKVWRFNVLAGGFNQSGLDAFGGECGGAVLLAAFHRGERGLGTDSALLGSAVSSVLYRWRQSLRFPDSRGF